MDRPHPNHLMVEGKNDQIFVDRLMRIMGLTYPGSGDKPIAIHESKGVDNLLNRDLLSSISKQDGLRALGIIIDADTNAIYRYASIRELFRRLDIDLPPHLPTEGMITTHHHFSIGVWVMPDNGAPGTLENLLSASIPDQARPIWQHATQAATEAHGLTDPPPFREVDLLKAQLHTYLAWQDPPGNPYGLALQSGSFNARSASLQPFLAWLTQLFGLVLSRS